MDSASGPRGSPERCIPIMRRQQRIHKKKNTGMSAHVDSVDSDCWPFPNRDRRNNESFTLKTTEYSYSLFNNFNDFNHLHFIVPWLPSCRTPENEAPWCNYSVEFFDFSF